MNCAVYTTSVGVLKVQQVAGFPVTLKINDAVST